MVEPLTIQVVCRIGNVFLANLAGGSWPQPFDYPVDCNPCLILALTALFFILSENQRGVVSAEAE